MHNMLKGVRRLSHRTAEQPASQAMASSNDSTVEIEVLVCASNNYSWLRPGNSVERRIRVSSPSALHFTDIEVSFQGKPGGAASDPTPMRG